MTWPTVQLRDVAELCLGKMLDKNKNKGELRPYLANVNVRWGAVDLADLREMRFEERELDRYGLRYGDIVMCEGGEPGRCVLWKEQMPGMMIQKALHRIRAGKNINENFLYYALFFLGQSGALVPFFTGSTIKHLPGEQLAKVKVPVPPLKTQRRIASILGAYDELIEVNRRRVAILEEMARGLFEEWFVRFRFPGHESVPMVEAQEGRLPEGWLWGQASDVVHFDPRTKVSAIGSKPFIPMGNLDTATSLIDRPEMREGNSGAKFINGDTLFARITPCLENGKTGIVRGLQSEGGVGFGSTEFIVMRGGRAGVAFTYCLSRLTAFRDHARSSMSGATGRQRARTNSVSAFQLAIPGDDALLQEFERIAGAMLELVGSLGESSRALAASRDLLLPRLISGQLSVEAAERELEAAA